MTERLRELQAELDDELLNLEWMEQSKKYSVADIDTVKQKIALLRKRVDEMESSN